ncbi:DNA-cytosine methyltransferase (plasmid) [Calothrix sp. NIES-4071]|nr:DNA-cytosine methyltransferase [Calothrix sp. NIES-4071]BAZ65065.1 DNA-cytosine methyltransferase [Calothrix sp. NIES-4105]
MKLSDLRVLDIFAGCGGLSLGFQNAGFSVVGAIDNWQLAINIYSKNFDHPVYNCDLSIPEDSYHIFKNLNCNFIIGGAPCQDFSNAGLRNEDNGRGELSISYARIIQHVRPQIFVLENVERYRKSNKYLQVKEIFKACNYGLTETILNASLCGVPQARKRYICIGVLGGADNALLSLLHEGLAPRPMTVRDYLGDSLGTEYYYRHARSYQRKAIFSIDEPSPTIRGTNRPISKNYIPHKNDACRDLRRVRALTTLERSYIQTFPSSFNFDIENQTKTDLEQVIGNAVPVKLGEYIAVAISKYLGV